MSAVVPFARPEVSPRLTPADVGVPGSFRRATFDGYHPRTPAQRVALAACRAYVETRMPVRGLILAGPVGTGKTHLAAAVVGARLAQGNRARFFRVTDLLDRCRRHAMDREERDPIAFLGTVRTLVLDDLGAERLTAFGVEQLFRLVDLRVVHERPLVVTTNHETPSSLSARFDRVEGVDAHAGERLVSRLCGGSVWIALDGPDHRLERPGDDR